MSAYKAELSHDEYLKALALFTMAHDHYMESVRFAAALNRMIMIVPEQFPGGHVDDAIYTSDRRAASDFDEALKRDGIAVAGSGKDI